MKNIFKAPVSSKDAMQYRTGIAHRYTIATLRWWALITSCAGGRHNMPPPLQFDLCPFDLESGVRVMRDVGYLCANFSLSRLFVLDLGPMYATDRRQTDAR